MNEELIKKVVAILNEKWGNEDWKNLTDEDKMRIVGEFISENNMTENAIQ